MILKYNALKVDEIEQVKKQPIENCIADTSISSLLLFIQKGLVDENEHWGVSKNVAMDVLDKYLEGNDKDDLVIEIMEALMKGGFLSRGLDLAKVKKAKQEKMALANQQLEEM